MSTFWGKMLAILLQAVPFYNKRETHLNRSQSEVNLGPMKGCMIQKHIIPESPSYSYMGVIILTSLAISVGRN